MGTIEGKGVSRRQVITWGVGSATGLFLTSKLGIVQVLGGDAAGAEVGVPGPSLDPTSIPKYLTALLVPPAMPRARKLRVQGGKNLDYYEIAVRQHDQQVLPVGLPATTVWGYGPRVAQGGGPLVFNAPSLTIEAKWNTPVRVRWINELVDASGDHLPHLLPVDQTLHWANPAGPIDDIGEPTLERYLGPVPMVTHVHGAQATDESDGYAEAWYLPNANDLDGYFATGSFYDAFAAQAAAKGYLAPGSTTWEPGTAVFQYDNDQAAATLWYHDHTLGMTRLNVYAGPAGFYLLRGGPGDDVRDATGQPAVLPGPAPALGDAPGTGYFEIPLAIQDRSFNDDGSLFFPDTRAFFDEFAGPYIGDGAESDIPPIWNPEFFGNTIIVNGNTWPTLDVHPRRYRFRFLNGCNSRFLILRTTTADPTSDGYDPLTAEPGPTLWQIGAEGGFLPAAVELSELLMSPAERADVIVDFAPFAGRTITLINLGPDEPFGGGRPGVAFEPATSDTTGQVMQFMVGSRQRGAGGEDPTTPPTSLVLPPLVPVPAASLIRRLLLAEEDSEVLEGVGPRAALLGIVTADATGTITGACAKSWMDPITENPQVGVPEVWEIYNTTADAHPIHIHEVQFQVVDRQALELDDDDMVAQPFGLAGSARQPEPWETGRKDTVIAYPGEVTRVRVVFDLPGLFVWHCHIVDHEDNEMMRPLYVGTPDEASPVGAEVISRDMLSGGACEDGVVPMSMHHR
jgi:spore coat protein A